MAKEKSWLITAKPAKTVRLKPRAEGEERTALRNYFMQAATRAEAQSRAEAHERLLEEQTGEPAWKIDEVQAA